MRYEELHFLNTSCEPLAKDLGFAPSFEMAKLLVAEECAAGTELQASGEVPRGVFFIRSGTCLAHGKEVAATDDAARALGRAALERGGVFGLESLPPVPTSPADADGGEGTAAEGATGPGAEARRVSQERVTARTSVKYYLLPFEEVAQLGHAASPLLASLVRALPAHSARVRARTDGRLSSEQADTSARESLSAAPIGGKDGRISCRNSGGDLIVQLRPDRTSCTSPLGSRAGGSSSALGGARMEAHAGGGALGPSEYEEAMAQQEKRFNLQLSTLKGQMDTKLDAILSQLHSIASAAKLNSRHAQLSEHDQGSPLGTRCNGRRLSVHGLAGAAASADAPEPSLASLARRSASQGKPLDNVPRRRFSQTESSVIEAVDSSTSQKHAPASPTLKRGQLTTEGAGAEEARPRRPSCAGMVARRRPSLVSRMTAAPLVQPLTMEQQMAAAVAEVDAQRTAQVEAEDD